MRAGKQNIQIVNGRRHKNTVSTEVLVCIKRKNRPQNRPESDPGLFCMLISLPLAPHLYLELCFSYLINKGWLQLVPEF